MKSEIAFLFLFFFLNVNNLFAQVDIPEVESWEENSNKQNYFAKSLFPMDWVLNRLISFYQQDVSTQSVSRCPFLISCSYYTHLAIDNHGFLVGILYFIDRNQYRENIEIRQHYFIKELTVGVLKLDDSFFLFDSQE